MSEYLMVRTERLELRAAERADVAALYAITSDPAVWLHAPQARHQDPTVTLDQVERSMARWAATGLDYWTVRRTDTGAVIGTGGVHLRVDSWNLYYRFAAGAWGHGYATELAQAALAAAYAVEPAVPVIARIVSANEPSQRLISRLGFLDLDERIDPADGRVRRLFADRALSPDAISGLS